MTVNYTTNLSLGQPVTGTESGTWGDDVNNAVTSYLDIAISGSLALTSASFTANALTLANTQGTSSATNIGATTAQYYALRVSSLAANVTITAPSVSKTYLVVNSDATYSVTVKASGQTGVAIVAGEKALVYYNGTDYIKITSNGTTALTSGRVPYATTGGVLTDSANLLYSGTDLTVYGIRVGRGAGAVSTNTVVGASAFSSNTSGTNNTSVGQASLAFNTASGNSALGATALYTNSTGIDSTAVGFAALYSNSTGNYNVALGRSALYSCTGNNNIGLGYSAGSLITSGDYNVVIGQYSGSAAPISATGSNWIVLSDGAGNVRQAIDSAGNSQFLTGAVVVYTPAPTTTISAATTLTNAQLQGQIVVTSGTSFTLTMPTGTTLNTLISWAGTNLGFDFSVINTATSTITMAVNTGVTSVGTLTVLTGISARFRIRRTAASTYVMYRV
jgi:hypothetical protein